MVGRGQKPLSNLFVFVLLNSSDFTAKPVVNLSAIALRGEGIAPSSHLKEAAHPVLTTVPF